jgi:hypothetical protein
MLIPNLTTFTGLDPTTTPSIKHGNLDPVAQFASQELLDMAVGSLYIQKSVQLGPNCTVLGTSACLWIKVDRSQDPCNALGSPKDWRRCCCFNLIEGTTPPQPTENPWCSAQTGDWYLQSDANGCSGLWLKIKDTCGSTDWINITGGKCFLTGTTPPDPSALCDYDLGAHYMDTSPPCPVIYIKIADNCNSGDWLSLMDGCVFDAAASPVGVLPATLPDGPSLCQLPVGAYVRDASDSLRLYIKIADNCDGNDYAPAQVRLTTNQTLDPNRTQLNPITQVLNVSPPLIGHRRYNAPVNGFLAVAQNTLIPVPLAQVYKDTSPGAVICPVAQIYRVIVPMAGYWKVTAEGNFIGEADGYLAGVGIVYNGSLAVVSLATCPLQAGVMSSANKRFAFQMNANDFFELYAWTNDPSGLTQTGSYDLRLEWISA